MALIRANSGSGGGSATQYTKYQTVPASGIPSWSNTPIAPQKVYWMMAIDSIFYLLTNVNPSTGQISDTNTWRSVDGGENYTIDNNFIIVRTSNSVALNQYFSSSTRAALWILLDE